jgi:hypothetical protein
MHFGAALLGMPVAVCGAMRSTWVLGVLLAMGTIAGCSGTADDPPPKDELAEYCVQKSCPASPEAVEPLCRVCPAAAAGTPHCTVNPFGKTTRFASSCGGDSVELSFGFEVTVWNFDADGQLIGRAWGSDTGSSEHYGRQCTRMGDESEDLCAQSMAGVGGAGAGGASAVE